MSHDDPFWCPPGLPGASGKAWELGSQLGGGTGGAGGRSALASNGAIRGSLDEGTGLGRVIAGAAVGSASTVVGDVTREPAMEAVLSREGE